MDATTELNPESFLSAPAVNFLQCVLPKLEVQQKTTPQRGSVSETLVLVDKGESKKLKDKSRTSAEMARECITNHKDICWLWQRASQ